MSTLGFGDITFESDAGRAFSVVVPVVIGDAAAQVRFYARTGAAENAFHLG